MPLSIDCLQELKGMGLHTLYVGCESGDEVRPCSPGFQSSRVSRCSRPVPESQGQDLALTCLMRAILARQRSGLSGGGPTRYHPGLFVFKI